VRLFFLVKYDDVANTSNIIDAFAKKERKLYRIAPVFAQFIPLFHCLSSRLSPV
jgi:hypothetical protein